MQCSSDKGRPVEHTHGDRDDICVTPCKGDRHFEKQLQNESMRAPSYAKPLSAAALPAANARPFFSSCG